MSRILTLYPKRASPTISSLFPPPFLMKKLSLLGAMALATVLVACQGTVSTDMPVDADAAASVSAMMESSSSVDAMEVSSSSEMGAAMDVSASVGTSDAMEQDDSAM